MDIAALKRQLRRHEGIRLKPYRDTVGKLTIGIGRNLDDKGISEAEASFLLDSDIASVLESLDNAFPWWKKLDDVRQRVLADMCFNMGIGGLLGFTNMLSAVRAENYRAAAAEMLSSRWAIQVGNRAKRLSQMMETGQEVP